MNANVGWATPFEAALSTRWVAAVVAEDGAYWLDQLSIERLSYEATATRARRIEVVRDDELPEGGVDLTIHSRDGSSHHDRRSGTDPEGATWETTADKFRQASQGVVDDARALSVIDMIGALEDVADIGELLALLGR
jgi:2-methylcitrate dehydratase PrpD